MMAARAGVHDADRLQPAAALGVLERMEQLPERLHAHAAGPSPVADIRDMESS